MGFHKMRGIFRLAADLLVSQQGHCSMALVIINGEHVTDIKKGSTLLVCKPF
jgi:hypothetical protein